MDREEDNDGDGKDILFKALMMDCFHSSIWQVTYTNFARDRLIKRK